MIIWHGSSGTGRMKYANISADVGSARIFERKIIVAEYEYGEFRYRRLAQWRINRAVKKAHKAVRKLIGKPPKMEKMPKRRALPSAEPKALESGRGARGRYVPAAILERLDEVLALQPRMSDRWLSGQVEQIDIDVRELFARAAGERAAVVEALTCDFRGYLDELRAVLERYIDIDEHPRYYERPDEELEKGREAVRGFAEHVISRIQRLGKPGMTEYRVNTDERSKVSLTRIFLADCHRDDDRLFSLRIKGL